MKRSFVRLLMSVLLCCVVAYAYGAPRGKEGEKRPGGSAAESKPEGRKGREQPGRENTARSQEGAGARSSGKKSLGGAWSEDAARGKQGQGQPGNVRGEETAASKKRTPMATGAQGAAAGAAAANNKKPKATGAEGAAAGAAAANNRKPQATGAEGAAAGAAAVNRRNPTGSAAGAVAGATAVQKSFHHPGLYGSQWYGDHHGAWVPTGWAAGAAWTLTPWDAVAGHCGYASGAPVSYDYGTNVLCEGGNVVVDGQNVGTAEEFGQQAVDLAEAGAEIDAQGSGEWLPLGVFALVRNEHQHPQLILQLAINEHGGLRGNYTDEVTDHTLPIRGSVDPQTQRAAWTVGENQSSVMEAGLSNLTQGEAPALLHKDGRTERWLLVRLEQPEQDSEDRAPGGASE